MSKPEHSWDALVDRLPRLLRQLSASEPHALDDLTRSKVRRLLGDASSQAGVYAFYRKSDDTPVYVGRSANLPQRLGLNHRSTLPNAAGLTKCLMQKRHLPSMAEARKHFFDNYQVRFLAVPDVYTRAAFEICAAMTWGAEFNFFMEH